MHPILVTLFGYPVPSFGVMVALGFMAAMVLCWVRAKQYGLSHDSILTWIPRLLLTGLVGAKLAFFVYFPALLWDDPWHALTYPGGLVLYGGILSGIVAIFWWSKYEKRSFWQLADFLSIPMLAGLGFGRIGCFLSGCCFGSPCDLPWAVQYPVSHPTHPLWLHPAPLYASVLVFGLMGVMLWLEQTRWKRAVAIGQLSSVFLIGYGVIRMVMEALRDDRITLWNTVPLSASQWVSVVAMAVGAWLLFRCQQTRPAPTV